MKEKILIHTCCGPCLLSALFSLGEYDLTAFYCNSNIFPQDEYVKRRDNTIKVCREKSINFVECSYDHSAWLSFVSKLASFQNFPEGGDRCLLCFEFRIRKTAEYARQHSFQIIATTLSSGSNKNAKVINAIGERIASEYGLKFLPADFKKRGGFEFSIKECRRLGIYRQNYCGCEFSIRRGRQNSASDKISS